MPRLGVNIDHIATLRQARRISTPDPVDALPILVRSGVDQVTCHLREDRRHIQDGDLKRFIRANLLPVNLEMAAIPEMVSIACQYKPAICTFVPEKREELTTEGGLDVVSNLTSIREAILRLKDMGIRVSLFVDPDSAQIDASKELAVDAVELHTGTFCDVFGSDKESEEFRRLQKAALQAAKRDLKVFAGHGLNRDNLPAVVRIREIEEYNIGHSIISRAVFVGLEAAVREVREILSA